MEKVIEITARREGFRRCGGTQRNHEGMACGCVHPGTAGGAEG